MTTTITTRMTMTRLTESATRTLSRLEVYSGTTKTGSFTILELPWRDNTKNRSCIPAGEYVVKRRGSPTYGDHLAIQNVPDRTDILIHWGNFPKDTEGCLIVGTGFSDIDNCGELEVTASRAAMKELYRLAKGDNIKLVILGSQAATTDPLEATLSLCLAAELAKNRALERKLLMLELEMIELKKVKGG